MRPVGKYSEAVAPDRVENHAVFSESPPARDTPAADWPTSGHIAYEGNGATSQNYSAEFRARGLHGFQSSSGSGTRMHVALQTVTDQANSTVIINGFEQNGAEFVGFNVRQKTAGLWKWLTVDGTWQDASHTAAKMLVHPDQDIAELASATVSNIVLVAQWRTPTGRSANCGSVIFSNKLMAHALGGYRQTAYNNTRAAFDHSVENRHTYFEVDLSYTSDERLVVSSPRTRPPDAEMRAYVSDLTYDHVMSLTTYGEPIMDARQLYGLIRDHPQYSFEIDFHKVEGEEVKKRVRSLLEDFQHDEEVLSRLLIQVYSAQMHVDIDSVYRFSNYQYLVGMRMDLLDAAITYSLDNGICALALRWALATQEVIERIKAAGLFILTYTVGKDAAVADALVRSGVDTVCTDYVTPAMLEHAAGQMGQNQFRIYYHSGVPEATETFSAAVGRGIAQRTIRTLKSGALEIPDNRCWQNDGAQRLRPLEFMIRGKRFAGWRMRLKIDNGTRWYCADGTFRTKKELRTTPPVRRYVFADQEVLPLLAVVEDSSVVMEATWEPANRIERVLKRWYRKRMS